MLGPSRQFCPAASVAMRWTHGVSAMVSMDGIPRWAGWLWSLKTQPGNGGWPIAPLAPSPPEADLEAVADFLDEALRLAQGLQERSGKGLKEFLAAVEGQGWFLPYLRLLTP